MDKKHKDTKDDDPSDDGSDVEVKNDRSKVVLDHVVERDINGKKFFIVPKDLLSQDILDRILNL